MSPARGDDSRSYGHDDSQMDDDRLTNSHDDCRSSGYVDSPGEDDRRRDDDDRSDDRSDPRHRGDDIPDADGRLPIDSDLQRSRSRDEPVTGLSRAAQRLRNRNGPFNNRFPTVADRVYMLRLFANHADTVIVRLRHLIDLTESSSNVILEELGWIPYLIVDFVRPMNVWIVTLSRWARHWRENADYLEGPDGPTDEQLLLMDEDFEEQWMIWPEDTGDRQ